MARYVDMMNAQNQQALASEQHPLQPNMNVCQPCSQKIKDRSKNSWHEEQSNEETKKSDEVKEHSFVHLIKRRNEMNQPNQNTWHDLDRVIEELKAMKKIRRIVQPEDRW